MGPAVAAMERSGVKTEVGKRIEDEAVEHLARARADGIQERELAQVNKSIIDLSGDLAVVKLVGQANTQLVSGAADFCAKFMADRAAKIEADLQAVERVQLEARRKADAQERQRQAWPRPGPSKDNDWPDFSPGR